LKLACNDHPPLRYLLDEGRADVDFLKITSLEKLETEVEDALTYRLALVHVGFGIADSVASYANLDWAWFNRMVRRSGSPHVALHLEVSTRNWPNGADLRYQSGSEARTMVSHLSALCRFLQDHLSCPLLLESMDYMGTELTPGYGVFRTSVEPALMWQLVEEAEAGVLLDLAHLRITASHLGVDARAFARSLPLQAVREIHVCGPAYVGGVGLRDDHQELTADDYALLAWTLERTDAHILTLEYPKARTVRQSFAEQIEALERQLTRFKAMTS
jgi:uncharacterized protein (UPF0276 family)